MFVFRGGRPGLPCLVHISKWSIEVGVVYMLSLRIRGLAGPGQLRSLVECFPAS
jgi:hypothetical protein